MPDVKCFCNNKNVLRAQSMVCHFVRHSVFVNLTYQTFQSKYIFDGTLNVRLLVAEQVTGDSGK